MNRICPTVAPVSHSLTPCRHGLAAPLSPSGVERRTHPIRRLALLACFALTSSLTGTLWASTGNVSNLNLSAGDGIAIVENYPSALAFTTGSHSAGYNLQSVTLKLADANSRGGETGDVTVALYSASGGNPGTSLATLTGLRPSSGNFREEVYSCSANCRLSAGTSYFIVFTTGRGGQFYWGQNASGSETNTPSNAGWSIANDAKYQNGSGGSWVSEGAVKLMKVSWKKLPTLTASGVSSGQATLTLSDHAAAWHYKYTIPSGGGCSAEVPAGTSAATLTDLRGSTSYTFKAYSDSECSTPLATAAAFTTSAPAAPSAPTNLSIRGNTLSCLSGDQNVTSFFFTLDWDAANANGAPVTQHRVFWRKKGTSQWDQKTTLRRPGATIGIAVDTGNLGGTYEVGVRARNSRGWGPHSAYADFTLSTPPAAPAKPTAAPGDQSATLAWTAPSGCGSPVTGYEYAKKTGSGAFETTWTAIPSSASLTSHTVTGLANGTAHQFKLRAVNAVGSGPASPASDSVTPAAPDLWVENIGYHSAMLTLRNWTGGKWSYKLTGSREERCYNARYDSFDHTGLDMGAAYTVTAHSGAGCAAANLLDTETFTTRSSGYKYPALSVSGVSSTGATLSLANHSGDWWYWETADETSGACRKAGAGASSVTLSGLTPNKYYQYKAFSGAGCGNSDARLDWITLPTDFTTAGPVTATVTDLSATWATLAVSGIDSGQWSTNHLVTGDPYKNYSQCLTYNHSTTSVVVTGLTAGTDYTFYVYRGASCIWVDDRIAAKAHTFRLSAGNVGPSSATLNLEHYEGGWSYRGGQGAGQASRAAGAVASASGAGQPSSAGQCQAMSAGQYTASLTGLAADTSYVYTAYAGASCAGRELAQASFATLSLPAAAGEPVSFGSAAVSDRSYKQNSPIEPLVLPAAEGGEGQLAYSLSPALPSGLSFDAATRTLSGTPAEASSSSYTYTATDADAADPGSASLTFTLAVAADLSPGFGGATVAAQSFVQNSPVEALTLPEASGGDGALTYSLSPALPAGLSFDAATRTISGTPTEAAESSTYTYTATDADGVDADSAVLTFTVAVKADLAPAFAAGAAIAAQRYQQTIPVESLTLPEASGGDGALTYSLSPALPSGLSFDAATRAISGTPAESAESASYTYTATDADAVDPDSASLSFTVAVAADTAPGFALARIADLRLERGEAMEPLALPEAEGGNGELIYTLSPALPEGLRFDPATRVLSGEPVSIAEQRSYEYVVTDSDPLQPDAASLAFAIEITYSAADQAMLSDALAAQGRALLSSVANVIGERFRAPVPELAESGGEPGEDRAAAALNALASWLAGGSAGFGQAGPAAPGSWAAPAARGGSRGELASGGVAGESHPVAGGAAGATRALAGASPSHAAGAAGAPSPGAGAFGPAAAFGRPETFGPPAASAGHSPGFDFRRLIQGRSFALPLNAIGGRGGASLSRWTLWGSADMQRFDGVSEGGRYDGGMASLYLGADARFGGAWLAGAALSRSRGESDYAVDGRSGRLSTDLTSVLPYIRGETGSGLELWAIGGFGGGEAEDRSGPAGAPVERAGLDMRMAAAGVRQPLRQRGPLSFSLVGGIGFLSLATAEGERLRAVNGLEAEVSQGRLALEVSRPAGALAPYLRLGARADGGDGQAGAGLEVVGGLRYSGARVDFEAQARWLAAFSGEGYKEYGGSARLTVNSRDDGSGLRLSLAPSWGRAGTGALLGGGEGLLGGPAASAMLPPGGGAAAMAGFGAPSLESGLGYGFAFERGLLTLGATHIRDALSARETVGLTWESRRREPLRRKPWDGAAAPPAAAGLRLRLGYERPTPATEGGLAFQLSYHARF